VNDLNDVVKEYITKLEKVSPMGMRMTKEVVHLSLDSPSMDSVIGLENRNQTIMFKTQDSQEALSAFFEKRKPDFKDN